MIRELRHRQSDRPPFRIEDRRDLKLLRAMLPLWFDQVWPQTRTPPYTSGTQTDFRITAARNSSRSRRKLVRRSEDGHRLAEWQEDVRWYAGQPDYRTLLGLVFDPLGLVPEPRRQENQLGTPRGDPRAGGPRVGLHTR